MGWREAAGVAPSADWRSVAGVAPKHVGPNEAEPTEETGRPPPTQLQSAASGVVQGASLGFGDEAAAALDVIPEATHRVAKAIGLSDDKPADIEGHVDQESADAAADKERGTLADYYRQMRDKYRAEDKTAERAHPAAYVAGKIGGNLAVPIPGGTAATTAGKISLGAAKGAGFGTALGTGESDADSLGGIAKDATKSGAFGVVGGGLGGLGEAGATKLATRFGAKATAAKTAEELAHLDEVRGSALGSMRQKLGERMRLLERHSDVVNNPNLSEATREASRAWLGGPTGRAAAEEAAASLMDQTPGQLGELAAAKDVFREAPNQAAKESADYFGKSTITEDMAPRAWHYARPAIASGVGGALAGPGGVGAGAVVGAAIGKPGRAISNLLKTPRFVVQSNRAAESTARAAGWLARNGAVVAGAADDDDPSATEETEALEKRFGNKKRR